MNAPAARAHGSGPPHFLGIGAQKAGTTWLYQMLKMHPEIGFPIQGAHEGKEVHFWSVRRRRGLEWYRSLFGSEKFAGEISPDYSIMPPIRIQALRRFNPAVRLIYILRNPIERAWSAANMRIRLRPQQHPIINDEYFIRDFEHPSMLRRANYARNLRNWFSVFPRESLLVMRYEQISADPRGFVRACAGHIGADPDFYSSIPEVTLRQKVGTPTAELMPRSLYDYLSERHHDHILRLEAFFGWDVSAWLVSYDEWLARRGQTNAL